MGAFAIRISIEAEFFFELFFFQFGLHIAISTSLAVKILEPFSVVVGGEITHPQLMVLTMVSNGRCVCERSLYVSLFFWLTFAFFLPNLAKIS